MNWENDTILLNGKLLGKNNLRDIQLEINAPDLWMRAIYDFLKSWFDDSEFITVHTSGSTGKPKEIQLSKVAMQNSARMTNTFFGLNANSVALLCLSADYIAGKMMLVRTIIGAFQLIAVEPRANPFEKLQQSIDFTAITPYQLHNSLEEIKRLEIRNSQNEKLGNKKLEIGKIIVGGAKIDNETEASLQHLQTEFYETYGMTETCSHIALRVLNGHEKSAYFKILNGISVRKNENDCLCIKAPHLLTHEICTNDIIELIDNEHFKIIGRLDNIINSGGVKLNPEQIEKKLEKLIQLPFFISSKPDNLLGNKVILVIQSEAFDSEKENELIDAINNTVTKYERPKELIYIPQFCYSANNKLLKAETLALE